MTILALQNVTKHYSKNRQSVLEGLNFEMQQGEICAFVGESGTGKSTLLKLISGLETCNSGTIILNGVLVENDGLFVPPEQRRVGYVFQDFALFPHMTVSKNVGYGLGKGINKSGRIREVLKLVGLVDYAERYPHELSGGEQQRIALARALAPSPSLLLLEEPFSNLDTVLKSQIRDELFEIIKNTGVSCLFVTHDAQDAISSASQIAVLANGKILQKGTPQQLFYKPVAPSIARFFGELNLLTSEDLLFFGIKPEQAQCYGIRPENVKFSLEQRENFQKAEVIKETFHGSRLKYLVKLENQRTLYIMSEINSPLTTENVFIQLPLNSVIAFERNL